MSHTDIVVLCKSSTVVENKLYLCITVFENADLTYAGLLFIDPQPNGP